MTQDELKQAVARAAIEYVVPGAIIGVGTGSTANFFIDELGRIKDRIPAAVASSDEVQDGFIVATTAPAWVAPQMVIACSTVNRPASAIRSPAGDHARPYT